MALKKDKHDSIVYSTEHSKKPLNCKNLIKKRQRHIVKNDGIVRIGKETKGRKGKGVTIITGIPLSHSQLLKLAQQLKQKCGAGGTVKNAMIEIQGDHRNVLLEELKEKGYKVKICGG